MKRKIQILIAIMFASCSSIFAQTQMVTFQVENPASTPVYVFGSWSGWGNYPGTPMTLVAPGKYSATIAVASNTTHEYLFVSGATPANEALNPTWTCTNGNTQYTNRVLVVGSVDTAVCYTWNTCNTCAVTPPPPPPTPVNVTFQVESPDSTPVSLIGSWNWSSFPGASMSLIAPNKYSVTMSLMPNSPYEFLFVNGVQTKEVLNPAWTCTNGNAQYTNRTLALGANDTSICFTWATCNTCVVTPPPSNVNVTFQVESPDSTPVYVFGSWSNWSNFPGTAMTSIGGNKYEAVVSLPANSNFEYLYVNGIQTKETLNPAWTCTNGNGQYTNRVLVTGANDFTKCNKWALCDSCGAVVPSNINVKFAVQSPDSTPVYVFGSWSNWSNFPGSPMTFNAVTGNYETSIPMASGAAIEYLYVNGTQTKEILNPAFTCTNGNAQYTNRMTTLGNVDTSFCNIWETCEACFALSTSNLNTEKLNVSMSNHFIKINATTTKSVDQVEIFDITGRKIYSFNNKVKTNENIPVELSTNTMYIINVKQASSTQSIKSIIKN